MSNKKEGKLRSDGSPCETNEQCKSNICHNEVCISEEENEKIHNELNNDFFQMRKELENIINDSKSNKDEIESIEEEALIKIEDISNNELKVINLKKKKKVIEGNLREEESDMKLNEQLLDRENSRNTIWNGHRWTHTNRYESDGYEFKQKIKSNKRAIKNMKEEIKKLTEQIDSLNKLIKDYNDELNTLIKKLKEKEELKKKYTREIGTILKDTSDTSKKYKELQKTKSNKKDKEENEICRICLAPILQNENYGVCPNAICNTKFHKDCIEQFCISTDIKEKYDYNQEIPVYGEDGFPIVDRNGYAVTQPLDVEYYVEKKCPLCGESWEEFCKKYIKEDEEEFQDNFNFRPIRDTLMDLNRIAEANRSPSNFSHSPNSPFSVPSRSSSRSRYSPPNDSGFNSPIGSPTRNGGKKRKSIKKRKTKRKKTKRKSYKKRI